MILKKAAEADRLIAHPPAKLRVALIYGRDRGGVRERVRALAAAITGDPDDPFNTSSLSEAQIEAQPSRLGDDLAALSLTGGRRVVKVQLSGERAAADKAVATALREHLDGGYNTEAVLLIEGGALGGASPVRRAAEGGGDLVAVIPVYEDDAGDLARLVRDALTKDGVRLTPDALQALVARLPGDRGVARQEIERLVLYLGTAGGGATVDDLDDFFGVEADASLADAASDAFGGRIGPALAHLRRAFAEGEGAPAAVAAASRHAQKLRRIGLLSRSGTALPAALRSSGVFWKQEREVGRQFRAWSDDALLRQQARILDVDAACKSAGAPDALLAERMFLEIAADARRAGL